MCFRLASGPAGPRLADELEALGRALAREAIVEFAKEGGACRASDRTQWSVPAPVGQRNIDELGGVSMSPVPSAQPVTVCCHRIRPTPGRRGQNQGLASLETGIRKGDAFWLCSRRLDRRPKQPLALPDRRTEEGLIPAVLAMAARSCK